MKNRLFLALLACCLCVSAQAQTKMADVIRTMPDSILPLLTKNDRLDFVDYLESNAQAKLKNKFGNECEMTRLTADYAHIRMSDVSQVELKLLPAGDAATQLVCIVSTYRVDSLYDSSVRFYSADWQLLPTRQYLNLTETDDYQRISLSESSTDLTVTTTTLRLYPDGENPRAVEPQTVTLKWKGGYVTP